MMLNWREVQARRAEFRAIIQRIEANRAASTVLDGEIIASGSVFGEALSKVLADD